jgi:hypothetical protein
MVKPIFTGKMDLDYARSRHPIWYEKLGGTPVTDPPGGKSLLEDKEDKTKEETVQSAEPAAVQAKESVIKGEEPQEV